MKRLLRISAVSLLFGLLFGALIIWQLPRLLALGMAYAGIEVDGLQRAPAGNWQLERIVWRDGDRFVAVTGVLFPGPLRYLHVQKLQRQTTQVDIQQLRISGDFDNKRPPASSAQVGESGLLELWDKVMAAYAQLEHWLPDIRIASIDVAVDAMPQLQLAATDFRYSARRIDMQMAGSWQDHELSLQAIGVQLTPEAGSLTASLLLADSAIEVAADALRSHDGLDLRVTLVRNDQQLSLAARWQATAWLPQSATAESAWLEVETEWLPQELPLRSLSVSDLRAFWSADTYRLQLRSQGLMHLPAWHEHAVDEELVDFAANLSLSGDRLSTRVEQFSLNAPGISAQLRSPVGFSHASRRFTSSGSFHLEIALQEQPLVELPAGRLWAQLRIEQDGGVRVPALRVRLDDGSGQLDFSGDWEPVGNRLSGDFTVALPMAALLAYLPAGRYPESITASGKLSGTVADPQVQVVVAPTPLQMDPLYPLRAGFIFEYQHSSGLELQVQLENGYVQASAAAWASIENGVWAGKLRRFDWDDGSAAPLELAGEVAFRWDPAAAGGVLQQLQLSRFELVGGLTRIVLEADAQHELLMEVSALASDRLNRLMVHALPQLRIEDVQLRVRPLDSHLDGDFRAAVDWLSPFGEMVRLDLSGLLSSSFTQLTEIRVAVDGHPVLEGGLVLPLGMPMDAQSGRYRLAIDPDAPLAGGLNLARSDAIEDSLLTLTGLEFSDLHLDLRLGGNYLNPILYAQLSSARLQIPQQIWRLSQPIAPIEALNMELLIEDGEFRLNTLRFGIHPDTVAVLSASLPYERLRAVIDSGGQQWQDLLRESLQAEIHVANLNAADWAGLLPPLLRPTGVVRADLHIRPGLRMDGEIDASGFSLRPSASYPSISHIHARMFAEDRLFTLQEAHAQIGDQRVQLSGFVDLPDADGAQWDFSLTGERVQLVRTAELILRSDLDLRFSRSSGSEPLISGNLGLRSSMLLYDFDLLAPSTAGGAPVRPPFFSVSTEPFARWQLQLQIQGSDFLQIRSAYFRGLFSANFRLDGTLGIPQLVGRAFSSNATMAFPGAKMQFQQAELYITHERPESVQLQINGIAERASYVVSMEVTHTVDDPRVIFAASPSLPNTSILRLLTTGSLSGNNLGGIGLYLGQGLVGPGSSSSGLLDRLQVDVGQEISRSGRNTVEVKFILDEAWHIEGYYDRFDAYNLDIVWRVFER